MNKKKLEELKKNLAAAYAVVDTYDAYATDAVAHAVDTAYAVVNAYADAADAAMEATDAYASSVGVAAYAIVDAVDAYKKALKEFRGENE
jgi:hypothetical protein